MTHKQENIIKTAIQNYLHAEEKSDGMLHCGLWLDYRERIPEHQLLEISKSDDPAQQFKAIVDDFMFTLEESAYDDLIDEITRRTEDENIPTDDICEYIANNVVWDGYSTPLDTKVHVAIALDTGDAGSDFTHCNLINTWGYPITNPDKPMTETCPLYWLAKQQDRLDETQAAVATAIRGEDTKEDASPFVQSIVEELENTASHMNTLTFLVTMPLSDFVQLRSEMKAKNKTSCTISKNAFCGLFDVWTGAGSIMEINLEKDVVLPVSLIWNAWIDCRKGGANGYGYGIDDVYGFTETAWRGTCAMPPS